MRKTDLFFKMPSAASASSTSASTNVQDTEQTDQGQGVRQEDSEKRRGQSVLIHIKVREFITNGATKVCVISVHVKLYLCVAGTRVRTRPRVGRWWVKMPGQFFNSSPSLD